MITVVVGELARQPNEAVMRPVRSDLAPLTVGGRDVGLAAGELVAGRLDQLGSVPVGGAVITPGGELPADFIIHVVTADIDEPQSAGTVQKAVRNGLRRAVEWGLTSLAMPPVGLGAGSMGAEEAAQVLVELLADHLDEGQPPLELVIAVSNEYEESVFNAVIESVVKDRFPTRN
jgi:O-acetyl-ADP-ribose deacetylase (regulator of RNase III)